MTTAERAVGAAADRVGAAADRIEQIIRNAQRGMHSHPKLAREEAVPPAPTPLTPPPPRAPVNPWLVVGAAFATGVVVAKVIGWRSRANAR
jgi:hypothetical protein